MLRSTTLALVLGAAMAACSGPRSDIQAPPEQTAHATDPSELTPEESQERFAHREYPESAVIERGSFGPAPRGTLVASSSEAKVAIADLQAKGPVVLVFYRGHW